MLKSTFSATLQRWSIFVRLAVVASQICEFQRNSPKIINRTIAVQGHPSSSFLVSIESSYATSF